MTEEEIKAKFETQQKAYSALEEEAKFVLHRALRQKQIKTHSIPTRVKALASFLEKVRRKEAKEPFNDVQDIVGLRVICLFLSDIPRIGEVIRESFNVISEDDKIEGAEITSFGYLSFHFNAEMRTEYKGPRYDSIAGMPFEIQVRTILMDAWANVSHYLDHKSDVDVPKALRRDFYALSGLFYVADSHFELFFKSSKDSSKQMSALASENTPNLILQEINLDSLSAYLRARLPDRQHAPSKSVSVLVRELAQTGYTTLQEVDKILGRTADAFKAFEKDRPPTGAKGPGRFIDVGVVRVSVCLVDEKFSQLIRPAPIPKKYIALVKNE